MWYLLNQHACLVQVLPTSVFGPSGAVPGSSDLICPKGGFSTVVFRLRTGLDPTVEDLDPA